MQLRTPLTLKPSEILKVLGLSAQNNLCKYLNLTLSSGESSIYNPCTVHLKDKKLKINKEKRDSEDRDSYSYIVTWRNNKWLLPHNLF